MAREVVANKWILGGLGFLTFFAVLSFLLHQHTIAPHRKQTSGTEELLRQQREAEKSQTNNIAKIVAQRIPADSTTLIAEKPTETGTTGAETDKSISKTLDPGTEVMQQMDNTEKVKISPYGFGPYPEVPEDYPSTVAWERDQTYLPEALHRESELLSRVLVKLWTSGDKNFRGGSTLNGKMYPHYHNTVYVRFAEYKKNGKKIQYPVRVKSGPQVIYTEADLLNPPPRLRILDLDSSGIDPYQYLDLP